MSGPASPHDATVDCELVRGLHRVTPTVALMASIGALVIALTYRHQVPQAWVWGWFGAFVAVSAARIAAARWYLQREAVEGDRRPWRVWAWGSLVHAALWGAASLVFISPQAYAEESVLHVTLTAVAAGAAIHLSGFYRVLLAYILLVLAPLVLRDLWIGGSYHQLLALMSALIGLHALGNGRKQSELLHTVVHTRNRNAELVAALQQENAAVRAARAQADAANAAKSRFFAAANHDLRQPLHAVGLLAQSLQTPSGAREVPEVSQRIVECVDHLGALVDELIELSRLDAGQLRVQRETFAFAPLLAELRATHEPLARAQGLRFTVDEADQIVDSDPRLVRRVLANLVANAIRYTAEGSVQVGVRADAPSRRLQVWVQDSGIGIAADELPRVFEEFYQVGNPARNRHQGVGLGLATVRRLSDALGLEVRVDSQPGHGSRFQFTLPLAEPSRLAPSAAHRLAASDDHFQGRQVLVIEDDGDSADALRRLLTGWGCAVQLAANGRQAQACVDGGFVPDFLLADLRLADGENGAEACRGLGRVVPTLIVTGDAGSQAAQAAGAMGYTVMPKPVNAMRLRACMNEAFSRPGLSRAPPHPANRRPAPPVSA